MTKKHTVLGQGLSAILRDIKEMPKEVVHPSQSSTSSPYQELSVSLMKPGIFQPRKVFNQDELKILAESIKKNGILQPIVVRKLEENVYEIIAGERRWRAAKLADFQTVPVIIKELKDKDAMLLALVENLQREDLNPLEEAESFQRIMKDLNITQEELAKMLDKSRSYIANALRLNKLGDQVKNLLLEGKILPSVARTIATHPDAEKVARMFLDKKMNVRQLEEYMAEYNKPQKEGVSSKLKKNQSEEGVSEQQQDIISTEKAIEAATGLNAQITIRARKKVLTIEFQTMEQLDSLLERLT